MNGVDVNMSSNATTLTRVFVNQHERMKQLQKLKGTESLTEEYRMALDAWITQESLNIMLADSQIMEMLESRLTKMEDRLVKMNARTGMDVAIALVGILNILAKKYNVSETKILEELRPVAAKHFSKSRDNSKKEL